MDTSERSKASGLAEGESGSRAELLKNIGMEIAKRELRAANIVLTELQELRVENHLAALVSRQQKKEHLAEIEEALMNEVSLWGWEVAEKATLHLNLPDWQISRAEQFLLAIHFETAKVENSLIGA